MIMTYENHYKCSNCDTEWVECWDSMCDDSCPHCDTIMTPHQSIDLFNWDQGEEV